MPEYFDVVIAGAGPAGLACAAELQQQAPHLRVLVAEAGRSYRRRPCPVDRGFSCTGCGGICNVISGFGGSMHYGDGAKLSLLPSGRRLIDLFGKAEAQALCHDAYAWLTAPLEPSPTLSGQDLSTQVVDAFAHHGLMVREYPVAVLGESDLAQVIEYCFTSATAQIRHQSELTAIAPMRATTDRIDGHHRSCQAPVSVTLSSRQGTEHVQAGAVVLATGRRGISTTAALLRGLGVPMTPPDLSVGVRLEMDTRLLAAIGGEHPDLKISQRSVAQTHKVKTFCFCGGENGGRVKFTHYHSAFGASVITLDGHETTERSSTSDRPLAGNFGLLCQVQGRGDAEASQTSFLDTYRRMNDGRPVVQRLSRFLARRHEPLSWPELERCCAFQPSVHDLTTAPVHTLFTGEEHASLAAGLRRVMNSILRHANLPNVPENIDQLADQILVLAPEFEFAWQRPAMDSTCQVPGHPVYVVGDAAGVAQGIVQGAMMGVAAARGILSTTAERVVTNSSAKARA